MTIKLHYFPSTQTHGLIFEAGKFGLCLFVDGFTLDIIGGINYSFRLLSH